MNHDDHRTANRESEAASPRRSTDLCHQPTSPFSAPIVLTSVWQCRSPEQADALLAGTESGYVYRRDAHPNADRLAERCRQRHNAAWAIITNSGMSALAAVLLAEARAGDHVLLARELYGKTRQLVATEGARWGLASDLVDPADLDSLNAAKRNTTRLLIVETISNPTLRVADLVQLSAWCTNHNIRLVVDHTFGESLAFRPCASGADYVVESLTKFANGHSDVVLGMVAGREGDSDRLDEVVRCWGFTGAPFDCWLAERGLETLEVRAERACGNALKIARWLESQDAVANVRYPGLASHPDHAIAAHLFNGVFGNMVTCDLSQGLAAVREFVKHVPFCPSLGEVHTTVSHPRTTSHRNWSDDECQSLGIGPGTIRLSVGCESYEQVQAMVAAGLGV